MSSLRIVEWQTPLSRATSGAMISLLHDGGTLTLELERFDEGSLARVKMVFSKVFGYRSLLEEYMTRTWHEHQREPRLGWTRTVIDSQWLTDLRENEPLFMLHGGISASHYMICTDDHVVEIIAKDGPEITVS